MHSMTRRFLQTAAALILGLSVTTYAEETLPATLKGMDIDRIEDGFVERLDAAYILLVNVDAAVDADWLDEQRRAMRMYLSVPIRSASLEGAPEADSDRVAWADARRAELDEKVVAAVYLVRNGTGAQGILSSPDGRWAIVDPGWVETKGIDEETRQRRMGRQVYRAVGFIFGVPYTIGPNANMKPIVAADDLDALSINFFPGNLHVFQQNAPMLGLGRLRLLSITERLHLGLLPPEMAERVRQRQAELEAEAEAEE